MDASVNTLETCMDAAAGRALARVLICCVVPLLDSPAYLNAQALPGAIRLLAPRCEVRYLQALVHFRCGQYVEAMQIWNERDLPSNRALAALCLRAIGEASWCGAAQAVYESGDREAIAIVAPWMHEIAGALPATTPDAPPALAGSAAAHESFYAFVPLRA
jgi:hypothetical protein